MEGEKRGAIERQEKAKSWRIAFWNVAGVANKEEEFWKGIGEWEVIVLLETWIEEKRWNRIKHRLPTGYRWKTQWAKRRNKRGRAMAGIVIGVREEMEVGQERDHGEEEGILVERITAGEEEWTVVAVYVNGDMERKLERIRGWMEGQKEGERTIIGGDFNARTGTLGGRIEGGEEEEDEGGRRSKDRKVNRDGSSLVKLIEETGWEILNGSIEGDEEGGRGATVIDYVLGDERTRRGVERMEIGDRVESDHHPMVMTMREGGVGERRGKVRERLVGGRRWSARMKEEFKEIKEVMRKGEETRDKETRQKGGVGRGNQGKEEAGEKRAKEMERGRERGKSIKGKGESTKNCARGKKGKRGRG